MAKENQKKESVIRQLQEMEKTQQNEDIRKAKKYNNEDKTIKAPIDKFEKGLLEKDNIQKINLDLEKNIMSLTLNNSFVFECLTAVWGENLNNYKSQFPRAVKNIVSENTTKNTDLFLNNL